MKFCDVTAYIDWIKNRDCHNSYDLGRGAAPRTISRAPCTYNNYIQECGPVFM